MDILILLSMGGLAGMLAGLLGIGGGIIIVPVLALVFGHQGVDPAVIMHVAIGTSLATIVVTSLSSIRAHQRRGAIDWRVVRVITPGIIVGGMMGALIAKQLSGETLRIAFGVFMVLVAAQMALGNTAAPHRGLPRTPGMVVAGLVIGTVASLMGVGGGSMSVPFLTWCNVAVRAAVATSAAIGLPIAASGAVSYIVSGWHQAQLPPWSAGYVNFPAFVGIVVASTAFAPLGAGLAHKLSPKLLRRLFAAFLLVLGARMLWG